MNQHSIQAYLKRINVTGDITPNLENLSILQKNHLINIPFENLDIHSKVPIELNTNQIFEKIVNQNRGGFCYELNGLFHQLLVALKFESTIISAQVFNAQKGYGPAFDHLALIVKIEQTNYLVDVGFGEFTFFPLKIELESIQADPRGNFVINQHSDTHLRVSKMTGNTFTPEYIFSTEERKFIDFTDMCQYHQSSPDSHFTQKKLITRPTENGRITLTNTLLKTRKGNNLEETPIESEEVFNQYLRFYF